MSSDEEDFMSDAFLANLESNAAASSSASSKPKTYQESRRQALLAQEKKNKANALKPYRQREEEARQEGMKQNLFERELEREKTGAGSGSKAMGMMMKMGYKVGEGLGKKRAVEVEEKPEDGQAQRSRGGGAADATSTAPSTAASTSKLVEEDDDLPTGGIGSLKRRKVEEVADIVASKPDVSSSSGHRFEPITVSFRAGRKGLGSKAPPPPPKAVASTPAIDPSAYRSRAAIEYTEKKAEGQLGAARRTVVELDERENRGFSILHLNPHYLPSFPEPLLQHLTANAPSSSSKSPPPPPIAAFQDEANAATADLLRRQMQSDSLAPIMTVEEEEEEVGGLGDASRGKRRDDQPEGKKPEHEEESTEENWEVLAGEARKFIALPATERLSHTLQYLREEFHYCLFCGVEYRSADELESDCPGLLEDDH